MSRLFRATELIGKPVVTISGESPLEIKDVVFDRSNGTVLGFTLRKHGFLGSPVGETLPWGRVHAVGPDAVMVADESSLSGDSELSPSDGGHVIGGRVMTRSGTDIGEVIEVIISAGRSAEVVGFEIEPGEALKHRGDHQAFIPLPETLSVSGENVIVPDNALEYIRDDLTGLGGAVTEFRARLGKGDQ